MSAFFLTLLLAAPTAAGIDVRDAWVAEPVAGRRAAAAYLVVENAGAAEVRLTAASAAGAAVTEIHRVSEQGGRMSMAEVKEVAVPPKGRVAFEPGGYHLMLIDLAKPLTAGESVELTLSFSNGATVKTTAPVRRREDR